MVPESPITSFGTSVSNKNNDTYDMQSLDISDNSGKLLWIWCGSLTPGVCDFAVAIGADPNDRRTYGRPVKSVTVGEFATMPHHAEPTIGRDGQWCVNGFMANKCWLLKIRPFAQAGLSATLPNPQPPQMDMVVMQTLQQMDASGMMKMDHSIMQAVDMYSSANHNPSMKTAINGEALSLPHSMTRVPSDQSILISYQLGQKGPNRSGGLGRYTTDGQLIRFASAYDPTQPRRIFRTYGIAVYEPIDRILTTNFSMAGPADDIVQIWSLSGLNVIATLPLTSDTPVQPFELLSLSNRQDPDDPYGLVFGLADASMWLISGMAQGSVPTVEHLGSVIDLLPMETVKDRVKAIGAAVPAALDQRYVAVPLEHLHRVVILDFADRHRPRFVAQQVFGDDYNPHLVTSTRLGADQYRMAVLDFQPDANLITGQVHLLHAQPGRKMLVLDRQFRLNTRALKRWPQGTLANGAIGHGAVFA